MEKRQSRSSLIGQIVVLQGDVERFRERCAIKDAEIERLRKVRKELSEALDAMIKWRLQHDPEYGTMVLDVLRSVDGEEANKT